MEKETVIHIRDLFKSIKLVSSEDKKEYSINIILKLDNDAWVDEKNQELFWDDEMVFAIISILISLEILYHL